MFKRTYTWLPVQETSQNPSRMGCEWLKNETLLFQGVLVKQYHVSLSNLRPGGGTRIPRHLIEKRERTSGMGVPTLD